MRVAWLLLMAKLANSEQMQVRFVPRLFRSSVQMVHVKFQIRSGAQLAFPIVTLENLEATALPAGVS
jgi:hypothetical protein